MTDHEYELEQDQAAEADHIMQLKEKAIMDALAADEAETTETLLDSLTTYIADRGGCFFEATYNRDHDAIVDCIGDWWMTEIDNWEDYV